MENKYVIFKLNNAEYGVDILEVKEVGEFKDSTLIPNSPSFLEGLINIRGDITPIINLKKRFNLKDTTYNDSNRIIVLNINDTLMGFLVDDTSQVISIESEDIDETPTIIATADKEYIKGVAKMDGRIVLILDLSKVLTEDEVEEISETIK